MKQGSGHPFGRLPRQLRRTAAAGLAAAALGGCAGYGAVLGGPGPRYDGPPGGVPPGHLPPPGECRIWYPDRPRASSRHPGHVGNCAIASRLAQP